MLSHGNLPKDAIVCIWPIQLSSQCRSSPIALPSFDATCANAGVHFGFRRADRPGRRSIRSSCKARDVQHWKTSSIIRGSVSPNFPRVAWAQQCSRQRLPQSRPPL